MEPSETRTAMTTPMALRAGARCWIMVWSSPDAVGAFGLLAGRVRPDGRALDHQTRVDLELAARDRRGEAVHPAWRGAALLLAHLVVLRTVARALEPL